MDVICFRLSGKYGYFLRAEANANGVTYPYPPRTVLLGIIGAVLGLEKDEPQVALTDANLAVGGATPKRFWHKTNVRKDPPAPLGFRVKTTDKGTNSEQRNFRFPQEWLWRPEYRVWAHLPDEHHPEFVARLHERRWHYTPCLGLAPLFADLEVVGEHRAELLPEGVHEIATLVRREAGEIDAGAATRAGLGLVSLRMSRTATADRVFTHQGYWHEHQGRPFPVRTAHAWRCAGDKVVFL